LCGNVAAPTTTAPWTNSRRSLSHQLAYEEVIMATARLLHSFKGVRGLNLYRPYSSAAPNTKLLINGQFVESKTTDFIDVNNPATNEHDLAKATYQQGKTLVDAEGDVMRGLQSHETWMPTHSASRRGVCAGIAPFNFPAMIPLWMFPVALVCGNTYVFKPSERVPGATMMLTEMLMDAGCPKGVVNAIHGQHEAVNFICDHPDIRAISFGRYIYEKGSLNGKRVQSNMGAKNHGVIMPDANKESTLTQLVGAAFGAAGQRCMALSTAVFVGEANNWLPELVEKSKKLRVNADTHSQSRFGTRDIPRGSERICGLVQTGIDEGANCILDGRDIVVPGYERTEFRGADHSLWG
ncbi:Methylmalonate-semialdehyde dehydrogenase [acylating]-like, partial [Homarus americanus]